MTRPSSISAAHRALAGLSLAPDNHAANLAAQAKRLLERRDGAASWLLAERLARLRFGLIADDLVLRAITLAAMNNPGLARNDIRDALTIDPRHPMANRLLLSSPEAAEREAAAHRLLRGDASTALIADALRVLWSRGVGAAGRLDSAPRHIQGWLAWRGAPTLRCRLETRHGRVAYRVEAEPGHRLAGNLVQAADISWPWPEDADWVEVACDTGHSVVVPERLWRHAAPPAPPAPSSQRPQRTPPTSATAEPRQVAVIIPVYGDFDATKQCLDAVLAHPESRLTRRIVAIDDATPDPRIAALLDELARDGRIELLRNDANRGFAASVNRGLGVLAADEDVVLLNADTVPPPDLCVRLARVAYLHDDIGTVTPLSNNGEYTSLPVRFRENPLPQGQALAALDRLAAENAGGVEFIELPNGIGFCLYVKRAVLDRVGLLSLQFGRGYCEDIDFCLRTRLAGFRNVCATGVFVGHAGTRSFKSEKRALVLTNLSRIDDLYPSYRRQSAEFVRLDPLRAPAGRLEWHWLLAKEERFALVVVTRQHDAGLIERHARARRASGLDTIVAIVDATLDGVAVHLRDHAGGYPQNVHLTYRRNRAPEDLARDLAGLPIADLAIADPGNLPADLARPLAEIGTGYDVLLADAGIFDLGSEGNAAATILSRARRILPPTLRFGRTLTARMPHLASKIAPLPDALPRIAAVQSASGGGGGLLIVSTGPSAEDSALIHTLGAGLQQTDREAGMVVDGAVTDDLETMGLGNVLVLGRRPDDRPTLAACLAPTSGVVFPSRRWGLGDTRVDEVRALALPVAYFDHTVARSRLIGTDLLLSPKEPLPASVSALLQWWRHLATKEAAAPPASTAKTTPAPPPPG